MTAAEILDVGLGAGAATGGLGILSRLAASAFTMVRAASQGGNGRGSDLPAEWRGRVEQILEGTQKLQGQMLEMQHEDRAEFGKALTAIAGVLEKVELAIDRHDGQVGPAVKATLETARQVGDLHREKFGV